MLIEVSKLAGTENLETALNTRLFKGVGVDRFSYWHRSIGEYLAARWLAHQANTKRKRRRLLKLFHSYGLVPASLRGVHAWLAIYPEIANEIIAADPIGVMEYGDADSLSLENARTFIGALERLAAENPYFRSWSTYVARGIANPQLEGDLKRLILSRDTPFQLRDLLIESIKSSTIARNFVNELRELVLNTKEIFACRKAASEILADENSTKDCAAIIRTLSTYSDDLSLRLAIEFSDDINYEYLDDQLIVDMAIAYAKSDSHTVGILWCLQRNFPISRLDSLLDCLVKETIHMDFDHHGEGNDNLTDFAFFIISRYIVEKEVSAEKVWGWLEPFRSQIGYDRESRKKVDDFFQEKISLRRAIQKLVLLDTPSDKRIWERHWLLRDRSLQLSPNTEDIIVLLGYLNSSNQEDNRWREIIQLVPHNGEIGKDVREAARTFAMHSSEALQWLNDLAIPSKTEWEIKNEIDNKKRIEERERNLEKQRKVYIEHLEDMKQGKFQWLIDPAKVYIKWFSDISNNAPAHERIRLWLGDEISDAAHQGFETFLLINPLYPSQHQIVESILKNEQWNTGFIFIAALAERFRKNMGIYDLSDEQIVAGLFHLRCLPVEQRAGITGLEKSVRTEIHNRGLWLNVLREYIEPQLKANLENINSFDSFINDPETLNTAADLLLEWLTTIENLPTIIKIQIIDSLLLSDKRDEIGRITLIEKDIADIEIKRAWTAVGFITNYEATITLLEKRDIEPELLWHIRGRTSDRYGDNLKIQLSVEQIEWIIRAFRPVWPLVDRPSGITGGNENAWNASQYLTYLIRHLGNNVDQLSVSVLDNLRKMPADSYTEIIKSVASEQRRKRIESIYKPTSIDEIYAVIQDTAPITVADLQEVIMEELNIVQGKIRSDDVNSRNDFFNDNGVPHQEEKCTDHLIGLLRQGSQDINFLPETHIANDKEVDITCSVGNLRLPIEVKGQWHPDLWHAADSQLDRLYTQDWQADKRGIYLVLWFGKQTSRNKKLKGLGRGIPLPKSPEELRTMLIEKSTAARARRIEVFVMDVSQ